MLKKLILKVILVVLLISATGIAAYHSLEWVLEKAFMSGMCGNTIFTESQSPNGKLKAVVFGRSCGATDGVSTQISILPVHEDLPNESGNISGVSASPEVGLRWADNDELVITHHGSAKFFDAMQSFDGVNIRYEVQTQPASNDGMHPTAR